MKLAQIKNGDRALDLCCGTGDITFALARGGAATTGLVFSAQMLEVAAQRQSASLKFKTQNLKFIQGDAQQLPFPENSFDIVTVGYGLRNLTSWERGLDEMWRVARPGARLSCWILGRRRTRSARPAFRAPEAVRAADGLAVLWRRLGQRRRTRIAETLSGTAGRGGKDARAETGNCPRIYLLGGAMAIDCGKEKPE